MMDDPLPPNPLVFDRTTQDIGWKDWPATDLVVLVCPPGAHEGKVAQGLPEGNYSTNAFRAGGQWVCVVPSVTVPHFRYEVAPAELQSARPPD